SGSPLRDSASSRAVRSTSVTSPRTSGAPPPRECASRTRRSQAPSRAGHEPQARRRRPSSGGAGFAGAGAGMSAALDRGRLTAWVALVSVLALLGYASRAAGGKPPKDAAYHYSTAASGIVQYAIILGVVLAI